MQVNQNQAAQRKVLAIAVAITAVVVAIFLYFNNTGNRWLSGHWDAQFVSKDQTIAAYNSAIDALVPTPDKPRPILDMPYYDFSLNIPFFEPGKTTWWQLRPGSMKGDYPSINITGDYFLRASQQLKQNGWSYGAGLSDPDAFKAKLQEAADKRIKDISTVEAGMEAEGCIRSSYCQQQHQKTINKYNDSLLNVEYYLAKDPYRLKIVFATDLDGQVASLHTTMFFACVDGEYCR